MAKKFYITAAIPYVNAAPHLGHTLEFIQADVLARYHQLLGEDVIFVSGADENAQKNVQAAKEKNLSPKKWCDINSQKFFNLKKLLNLTDNFIFQRSSDKKHYQASQKLWRLCQKEDIELKEYKGLYCLGCEEFKTEKDLVKDKCPEHPHQKLERVREKNYFFKLSHYQKFLKDLISKDKLEVIPRERKNEVLAFINQGLKDFSISRSAKRMAGWGIPVPGDSSQVMYVWFDALNVYQSGVGFGWNEEKYKKWWPADIHCIGKGILRFHAIYWPAILKSAGLELPKKIFVHGYLTIEGQKISKSLGNVIDPKEVVKKYGTDALRYFLLKTIHPHQDGDFNWSLFEGVYQADLANGIGNLVQRLAKLCENAKFKEQNVKLQFKIQNYKKYNDLIKKYKFNEVLAWIWQRIGELDKEIDINKPWDLIADLKERKLYGFFDFAIKRILEIAFLLKPFLPETAKKIEKIFGTDKIRAPKKPLFPRLK
jgi:methionyl-tRNA synthetase